MSIGVALVHHDARILDEVAHAIDRGEGTHVVGFNERVSEADVVLAETAAIESFEIRDVALVVLASRDPVREARRGFELGATGLVVWPEDEPGLGRAIAAAALRAPRRRDERRGIVVAVAGARGGAGASMITALAAREVQDSLIIDLEGGPCGQRAFAPDEVGGSLERALSAPTPEVIVACAEPHDVARALYPAAGALPPEKSALATLLEAARRTARVVFVDAGRLPVARTEAGDRVVVVCADDVGSLRAARAYLDSGGEAAFVLNRRRRRGLRAGHLERALGEKPIAVLRPDRRLAVAPDLGRLPRRVPRSIADLVESVCS